MTYKALDLNVDKLFNENLSYKVPRYQRGYVWIEKNWNDLMRDIVTGYKNDVDYKHFLGTFVFEDVIVGTSEISFRNIIDGQQRLTTMQIIIFALIYILRKHISENVADLSDQDLIELKKRIKVLQSYISFTDRTTLVEKARLDNGLDTFNKLAYISVRQIDDYSIYKVDEYTVIQKDSVIKSFWFIVKYMENSVVEKDNFEKSILDFQTAFLSMNIITVSSSNKNEVLNLFEVLNARGLYLKQTELLKNFIFRHIKEDAIRDDVKIEWEKMNNAFFNSEIDSDDYLFHFMRSYYSINDLKKEIVYQCLKEQEFKDKNSKVPLLYANFIRYYETYINISCNISDSKTENRVFDYFVIKGNKQVRSLLLSLKVKKINNVISEEQYNKLILAILNFFIGFNIAQKRSNSIERYVAESSNMIFWATSFANVNKAVLSFLNDISHYYPSSSDVKTKILEIRYSNKNKRGNISGGLLVYYLRPIYDRAKVEEDVEIPYSKINIEHIILDNIHDETTWKLGNLILVTEKLNSNKLKAKPYAEKRVLLLDSDISYNRSFAKDYTVFSNTEILSRTEEIASKIANFCVFDLTQVRDEYRVEAKLENVRTFINDVMGNDPKAINKLDTEGVKKFSEYIKHNKLISEEVKSAYNLILN